MLKNLENDIPFYFLRGSTEDSAEAKSITQGNFYYSTVYQDDKETIAKPIIDKNLVFGMDTTLQTTVPFNTKPLHTLTKETAQTTLYSKLLTLGLVKTATLAPFGLGIEMEADKPGWNDSLNGLPGMIGASTSELYEVKRLFDLMLSIDEAKDISVPVEVSDLLRQVLQSIQAFNNGKLTEQAYWHEVATHRENYRERVYKGLSGEEVTYIALMSVKMVLLKQHLIHLSHYGLK